MFHVKHSAPTPELIREVLQEAGLPVFPGAAEKLAAHAQEMSRWNRSIRLTAITDPAEVAVKHVADSLFLLRFAPFPGRLLDFGSGAGYPGIPLALYLPGTHVTLLDASVKKCAFLSRVRGLLGLSNVEVVHGKADPANRLTLPPQDHIVSRATASPSEGIRLLSPYLAEGGRFLFLVGPGKKGSKGSAGTDGKNLPGGILRRERFRLPRGMGEREILEIEMHARISHQGS